MFNFGLLPVPLFLYFKVVGEGVMNAIFDHWLKALPVDRFANALTLNIVTWFTGTEQI